MAYRKRRGAATAETTRTNSGVRAASGTDLAPAVLAMAQQIKQLQQDLVSIKKRLADLEAPATAQAARPAAMVEQAREVVQSLQSLFGTVQAPRKSEPAASSAPVASGVPVVPAVPAAPEPPLPAPSVLPDSASPPTEARTTKLPPWMAASPKDATQFVPQWTLWSPDFLDRLNTFVERMLASVPEAFAAQGEAQAADKMRQWLASDKPVTLQVASQMARRIVATPPAARTSAQQRMDLARLVARDIEESLPIEPPADKPRMASMLSQEPRLPVLLGVFLTVALRSLAGAPATSNV